MKAVVYTLPAAMFLLANNFMVMRWDMHPAVLVLPLLAVAAVFHEFHHEEGVRQGLKAVGISTAIMLILVLDVVLTVM